MTTPAKRLNSIEALRFLFMLTICYWHCYGSDGLLKHGYMPVEWFFVLSGILMYKSYITHPKEGVLDYTIRKYLRFAPLYLIVMGYCYIRYGILPPLLNGKSFDSDFLLKSLPEALMLQDCGIFFGGVNYPLWYLCALLWGGALCYSLLRCYKHKALSLIFPLIIFTGYTYLFNYNNGNIQVWDVVGGIKLTMLRGICGISLGVVLGHFMEKKHDIINNHNRFVDFISILSLIFFVVFLFAKTNYDNYGLITVCFILIGCFNSDSVINKITCWSGWTFLGTLSWEMLICHGRISIPLYENLIDKINIQESCILYLLYFVILIVTSLLIRIIYKLSLKCYKSVCCKSNDCQ